jgi:DNA polymerase-3 subunit delta'
LPIAIPPEPEAKSWLAAQNVVPQDIQLALQLARGAPLAALKFNANLLQQRHAALEAFFEFSNGKNGKRSPSAIAEQWVQQDIHLLLTWLSSWLADLLRLKTGSTVPFLDNPDLAKLLLAQAVRYDSVNIHRFWSQVLDARRQLQTNLNPQLLTEALLIKWSEMQP